LRSPKDRYLKFPHPTTMRPIAIDAAGDVLGIYGPFSSFVGFLRSFSTGTITYSSDHFEPFAMNSSGTCTGVLISDRGFFAGAYAENPCLSNGKTRIGVPDAYGVSPAAINTMGNVAGWFGSFVDDAGHGFVWNAKKQHAKAITVPNSVLTQITGMNDAGTAVGTWQDSADLPHSFFVTSSGVITSFDPPGAPLSAALGINHAGAIAGYFCITPCQNGPLGYVRNPDGTFSTISFPGSTVTDVNGINKSGTVTGTYVDTAGVNHGFTY
jgi:hypothetical protein